MTDIGKAVELMDEEDAVKYGRHSAWCTAKRSGFYASYCSGRLFVLFKPKKRRPSFQLYVSSGIGLGDELKHKTGAQPKWADLDTHCPGAVDQLAVYVGTDKVAELRQRFRNTIADTPRFSPRITRDIYGDHPGLSPREHYREGIRPFSFRGEGHFHAMRWRDQRLGPRGVARLTVLPEDVSDDVMDSWCGTAVSVYLDAVRRESIFREQGDGDAVVLFRDPRIPALLLHLNSTAA